MEYSFELLASIFVAIIIMDVVIFYFLFFRPYKKFSQLKSRNISYEKAVVEKIEEYVGGKGGKVVYLCYKFNSGADEMRARINEPAVLKEGIKAGDTIDIVFLRSDPKVSYPERFVDNLLKNKRKLSIVVGGSMASMLMMLLVVATLMLNGNIKYKEILQEKCFKCINTLN